MQFYFTVVSGFKELASNSGAFNIDEEFFASDLTFEDTPLDFDRVVQIQLQTDQTSILEITLDGTNFVFINNGVGISGLATFTMLVKKTTLLNFRNSDVAGLAVSITVGV